MRDKNDAQRWFPFWVDKWLFGSTRIELTAEQRGVWLDLMALGAKDNGFIRANPETPYLTKQLAAFLNIEENLLTETIKRCVEVNKLIENETKGIYYIKNWGEFQFCDRWKREIGRNVLFKKQSSDKTEDTSSKTGPIVKNRIEKNSKEEKSINNQPDFISFLKSNPAYSHIQINNELSKMDAWLLLPKNKGRKKTPRFILNWLNKIEKPLGPQIIKESKNPEIIPKDFKHDPKGEEKIKEIIQSLTKGKLIPK